jgi:carbonic anhydrase
MLHVLILLALIPAAFANEAAALTGWDAFSTLQNGNMRFYEGKTLHMHQSNARREELASDQKPHTIILSCSDSRLPPEIIFDQGLGDIFTVRVAGNVVNAEAIASIEYAIVHLGSKLLLVMGHESCGAVKEAVGSRAGISNGSENLDTLVEHIRSHITASALASTDTSLRQPVKENVAATLKELLRKSEIVSEAVRSKGLILAQGIYSLKTGRVEFWDVGAKSDIVAAAAAGMPIDAPVIREQNIQEEIIPERSTATVKKLKRATEH